MTPVRIIEALGAPQQLLPMAAIRAARAHAPLVTPLLLALLEAAATPQRMDDEADDGRALFLGIHMLAEFREGAAFAPLLRFLRADLEWVEFVLGDAIEMTLAKVMVSTYDGDFEAFRQFVLDHQVNEYLRKAALHALAFLTKTGAVPVAAMEQLLDRCFHELLQTGVEEAVWDGWVDAIAMLGWGRLSAQVRKVFLKGLVTPYHDDLETFERALGRAAADGVACFASFGVGHLDNLVDEFAAWAAFSDETYAEEAERADDLDRADEETPSAWRWDAEEDAWRSAGQALRDSLAPVGRNDPCPCGSGKKYRKCCLQ